MIMSENLSPAIRTGPVEMVLIDLYSYPLSLLRPDLRHLYSYRVVEFTLPHISPPPTHVSLRGGGCQGFKGCNICRLQPPSSNCFRVHIEYSEQLCRHFFCRRHLVSHPMAHQLCKIGNKVIIVLKDYVFVEQI